jgi:hypothetical protein
MPSVSLARRYSALTISRVVKAGNKGPGWVAEFEGDDETPSPKASMTTTKYSAGSTSLSAPVAIAPAPALLPLNQVGMKTPLERSALSVPQVR